MYSILKEKDELYFAEQTVITDNETILDNLTSPDLKIVKKLEEATVIWMSGPFSEEIWE